MAQNFQYTYTCEKCGGQFYSKVDPSTWRHHVCNKCSGKQYKDYPVNSAVPTYNPQPVPTAKPVYNNVQPQPVSKKEFNVDEYITDLISTYAALKLKMKDCGFDVPEECLCAWATSVMIQKGRG